MKNISLDNPLWLFILIPLLIGVLVPFFIAIRKENKSKSVIASLVIHLIIALLIGFAAAGTVVTAVITKTEVVVVADVSYSSRDNKAEIDRYIAEIESKLPENSKLGIVLFGKDQKLHTSIGEVRTPVTDEGVDTSATDIASALDYASTLFGEGVLKRIVLLTDGAETVSENVSGMIASVEKLNSQNISVDAVYLDSNIKEGVSEVQISGVDYIENTYLNHKTEATILIQSGKAEAAKLYISQNGEPYQSFDEYLSAGYNTVSITLPTDRDGEFEYSVKVEVKDDSSPYNNSYSFNQSVSRDLNVLFITSEPDDIHSAYEMFSENTTIDVVYIEKRNSSMPKDEYNARGTSAVKDRYEDYERVSFIDPKSVPCSVENLSLYDEFILSSVDPRDITNVTAFVESLEVVVSRHGKHLSTFGDVKIQNKSDETLAELEDMLPVKFGNNAQDPRLYAIVIDVSRSMFQAGRFDIAKTAAIHLLSILSNDDDVMVVTFAGSINVIQPTTKAANRDDIAKLINALTPEQGTSTGAGLQRALDAMIEYDHDLKEVMLISDGHNYPNELVDLDGDGKKETNVYGVAEYMQENDIKISTMNVPQTGEELATGEATLKAIAKNGAGDYYYIQSHKAIKELVFSDVAEDLTESVIDLESVVHKEHDDEILRGFEGIAIPNVFGYVQSKAKVSAKTVLTVDYLKPTGVNVKVPLYSYWNYGNGKVASYTSTISGKWSRGWQSGSDADFFSSLGRLFFSNVAEESVPEEKNSAPYFLSARYDGIYSNIEITPVEAKNAAYATVNVTLTYPDGTAVTEKLTFDSSRFFYRFETPSLGKYGIAVEYITENGTFHSSSAYHISYSPEYDAFVGFDPSPLHAAIRHRGTVSEDEVPELTKDGDVVTTYRLPLAAALFASAVALFVIDIIVRKIKWADIKSLFKKHKTGKERQ